VHQLAVKLVIDGVDTGNLDRADPARVPWPSTWPVVASGMAANCDRARSIIAWASAHACTTDIGQLCDSSPKHQITGSDRHRLSRNHASTCSACSFGGKIG
jgi:hypothetical protein